MKTQQFRSSALAVALLAVAAALALLPAPGWAVTAEPAFHVTSSDFGRGIYSVAVDGDTAILGAPYLFRQGEPVCSVWSCGAAYVFVRGNDGWQRQAELRPADGDNTFGLAVALEGDTAVVTAPSIEGAGSAYVFTRSGEEWMETARVLPDDSGHDDGFGISVAIDDATILIGSRGPITEPFDFPGAAYVFTRSADGWQQQARLQAPEPDQENAFLYFGTAVDLDGDNALIGTLNDNAAYVFVREDAVWHMQAKLVAEDAWDLGEAVAIDGDTALVGGFEAAYVFQRRAGAWTEQARLAPNDAAYFGGTSAVALRSGVAVVGAPRVDPHDVGAAYLFRHDRGGWTLDERLAAQELRRDERFGLSLALAQDTLWIGGSEPVGATTSARVFQLGPDPRIHCPGDIDGDGTPDIALVSPRGDVTVRGLDGRLVNRFALDARGDRLPTALVPDTNRDGAAELVALGTRPPLAELRDLLSSGALGSVPFSSDLKALDLAIVPDQTGNGVPELATLSEDPATVELRDGLTGELINTITFSSYVFPMDLRVYPDLDGNGAAEIGVLGDNRTPADADKIEIRDTATGAVVREVWLGKGWRVLQHERIADLDGDGAEEVAILRVHPEGNVNVMIRNPQTGGWLGSAGFNPRYPPTKMLRLDDLNGNGSDEIAVFGRRLGIPGSNQKAEIRDSLTGALAGAGEIFFDRNSPVRDIVSCGDIGGTGGEALAALARRITDGAYKVIVKDAGTGERVAVVRF